MQGPLLIVQIADVIMNPIVMETVIMMYPAGVSGTVIRAK